MSIPPINIIFDIYEELEETEVVDMDINDDDIDANLKCNRWCWLYMQFDEGGPHLLSLLIVTNPILSLRYQLIILHFSDRSCSR